MRRSWHACRLARGFKLVAEQHLGKRSAIRANDESQVAAWSRIKGRLQHGQDRQPSLNQIVVWSVCIQPLQAEEGCPFLSNAEVEELTGRKLELFKLTSMTLPDGAGTLSVPDR